MSDLIKINETLLDNDYPTLENYNKQDFEIDGTVLKKYKSQKPIVKIPYGVTAIYGTSYGEIPYISSYGAFSGCSYIEKIIIPDTVKAIGDGAFSDCKGVEIYIPSSVASIGDRAFSGCSIKNDIVIPPTCNVYRLCFSGALLQETYFKSLTISCNIANGLFSDYSYSRCERLILSDGETIKFEQFKKCNIKEIILPTCLKSIENSAFSDWAGTSIIIPENVKNVGNYIFNNCKNLKRIYCEALSKPFGWDDDWNKNCSAIVIWDSKNKDSNGNFITIVDEVKYTIINGAATITERITGNTTLALHSSVICKGIQYKVVQINTCLFNGGVLNSIIFDDTCKTWKKLIKPFKKIIPCNVVCLDGIVKLKR